MSQSVGQLEVFVRMNAGRTSALEHQRFLLPQETVKCEPHYSAIALLMVCLPYRGVVMTSEHDRNCSLLCIVLVFVTRKPTLKCEPHYSAIALLMVCLPYYVVVMTREHDRNCSLCLHRARICYQKTNHEVRTTLQCNYFAYGVFAILCRCYDA